ncbi:hypothetical protein GGTG_03052 [Gaeumannomyces tritici R3-111a-1]|uniref:Uncharacterized protein n=1 Tax=Gaeumannomyces tritici (strain R3-111a-1) TaxID=644352 RepID=J3NP46_GAET3|nr:hypothetical protein GGTG_03052 [Gaeumannomyces tritici R3-111a-1]EJT77949.1 hypothetical protein GGTG_03052 [Gaeumannomyces tritici R3-111a-1]
MSAGRCTTIPRAFSYILPIQSLVTGAVVYGIIYIFTFRSLVFILGVVATGLQFFLGIYCCLLGAKSGIYHRFIIPTWLVALAGIWIAPLYYLTAELDSELKLKEALGSLTYANRFPNESDARIIWRAVGVAGSAVNCFIDLILLAIFIVIGLRSPPHHGFNPNPATAPNTAHVHAQPFAPAGSSTFYQSPPSTTAFGHAPSTSGPSQGYHSQPSPLSSAEPSPSAVNTYHQQLQHLQQQQFAQQPDTSSSPALSSTDGKHSTIISTVPQPHQHAQHQQQPYSAGGYDPQNRIEILRRLVSLQAADGHWDWSQDLHEVLRICGRDVTDASPVGMTSIANALTVDICQYVWTAQREGREHTALTAAEMITLQGMNWDLGWAQRCTDMAAVWLLASRRVSGGA